MTEKYNFNVIDLLESRNIDYATHGKNVGKNFVGVNCPLCGDDESYHAGFRVDEDGNYAGSWNCWRDDTHGGKNPAILVRGLLNCTLREAHELVSQNGPRLETFSDKMKSFLRDGSKEEDPDFTLSMPPEFKKHNEIRFTKKFNNYMSNRGFTESQVRNMSELYDLRFALSGDWANRIIIPIYEDGDLKTWTARHIDKDHYVKYKTLSRKHEGDYQAKESIKNLIFNYDELKEGGNKLYIVEGPFDALKMDFFGRSHDLRATSLFGKQASNRQITLLMNLSDVFNDVVIFLDSDAYKDAMYLQKKIARANVRYKFIFGKRDPGDFTKSEIEKIAKNK